MGARNTKGLPMAVFGGTPDKRDFADLYAVQYDLMRLNRYNLRPLEDAYNFDYFHSPALVDADFEAKPSILVIGQYSAGKSSMIKHLLGKEYPGMRIGPEPTTERFTVIMHGDIDKTTGIVNEGIIPGHALVNDLSKPYDSLGAFGNGFLSRFQASCMRNEVLHNITIIDSPGILAGGTKLGYDFDKVVGWFAGRVDKVIVVFDVNKVDLSDEFTKVFKQLRPFENKIIVVLNKADTVETEQLIRVYGGLMWGLGKIMCNPEVCRVYIASLWDGQFVFPENRRLFENEKWELFNEIKQLPQDGLKRKVNDLLVRASYAKIHAYIIDYLKMTGPKLFNKKQKEREQIENLDKIFDEVANIRHIPRHDFPDVEDFKEKLEHKDYHGIKFKRLRNYHITKANQIADEAIVLIAAIRRDEAQEMMFNKRGVQGGALKVFAKKNPFAHKFGEGIGYGADCYKGKDGRGWIVDERKPIYDELFCRLKPVHGRITGTQLKEGVKKEAKLTDIQFARVWNLADYNNDGLLDHEEHALAMHLLLLTAEGHKMPDTLPKHLIPPSQRPKLPGDAKRPKREAVSSCEVSSCATVITSCLPPANSSCGPQLKQLSYPVKRTCSSMVELPVVGVSEDCPTQKQRRYKDYDPEALHQKFTEYIYL